MPPALMQGSSPGLNWRRTEIVSPMPYLATFRVIASGSTPPLIWLASSMRSVSSRPEIRCRSDIAPVRKSAIGDDGWSGSRGRLSRCSRLGKQFEEGDVSWSHDCEVPVVQRGDLGDTESFGCGHHGRIDRA